MKIYDRKNNQIDIASVKKLHKAYTVALKQGFATTRTGGIKGGIHWDGEKKVYPSDKVSFLNAIIDMAGFYGRYHA